jgi:hypothetical protein
MDMVASAYLTYIGARCESNPNHPGKAGFVELSSVIVSILLLLGPLALAAIGEYLRIIYGRFVRHYERSLDDAYFINFQARAAEARMLDLNVGYALQRAKRTIDQIRQNSPDTLRIQSALGQVSEWLHSAAETSDRALRSLEDERLQTKKSQIGVFTKDDLDG